jgi:metallo-beta-lactamase family protein
MADVQVAIHGAGKTVTGSCYEVRWGDHRILVDCGLFQGSRTLEALNHEAFAFDPRKLDAVILTHAHLDHSGMLPRLAARGFSGPIWSTGPTADLLEQMLPDAARIQEQDAERRNRRADRADEPAIEPLYTLDDAEAALALRQLAPLETGFEAAPGMRAKLWNAGHILGSASLELRAGDTRLLFSGDIGPDEKAFHPDPDAPRGFDHVFCESTYGDRDREKITIDQRRALLETEVKSALARGGNLVIPVFALERTQELLLDLARLINNGRLPHPRVFLDSPLATRITDVFTRHSRALEDMGAGNVFRHPAFHYVEDVAGSRQLNNVSGAIIMAGSGMCEGGRIRHHLISNLARPDSTILFVGYQAQGTLGRIISGGAKRVRISGRDIAVRAAVRSIENYSAHADRSELLAWIQARTPINGSLFLTHGEASAIEGLRRDLQARCASIITPEIGEVYSLPADAPARRIATGRTDIRDAVGRDWQNDYADFTVRLKRELQAIEAAGKRREAIARMRAILSEYQDARKRGNGAG